MKNEKITIPRSKLKGLYLKKRKSTSDISKIYRCNPETIRRRLIEYKIKRRLYEIKINIKKDDLVDFYENKNLSFKDIAKKYNCSQWTIRENLLKNNIKLRKSTSFLKWRDPGNTLNPNIFQKKKYWRTIASSKLFYNWFNNLTIEDIRKIALDYPIYFLKGIHESEGCLSINHDKRYNRSYLILIIVSCEENTIQLTKQLIEGLGFHPRLNLRKYPPGDKRKPIWVLNLGKQEEIKSFLNIVNSCTKNLETMNQKLYKYP